MHVDEPTVRSETEASMTAAALPLRAYTPLRMVLTVCGQCFTDDPDREVDYGMDILQGNLVMQDGSVYLRRYCQRGHGEVVSLYDEDYRCGSTSSNGACRPARSSRTPPTT